MRISDWSSDVCSSDLRFGADPRQFRNVIVKSGTDGRLVRLEDVARVEPGGKDYNSRRYLDGQTAVAMGVVPRPGTNALETSEQRSGERSVENGWVRPCRSRWSPCH